MKIIETCQPEQTQPGAHTRSEENDLDLRYNQLS